MLSQVQVMNRMTLGLLIGTGSSVLLFYFCVGGNFLAFFSQSSLLFSPILHLHARARTAWWRCKTRLRYFFLGHSHLIEHVGSNRQRQEQQDPHIMSNVTRQQTQYHNRMVIYLQSEARRLLDGTSFSCHQSEPATCHKTKNKAQHNEETTWSELEALCISDEIYFLINLKQLAIFIRMYTEQHHRWGQKAFRVGQHCRRTNAPAEKKTGDKRPRRHNSENTNVYLFANPYTRQELEDCFIQQIEKRIFLLRLLYHTENLSQMSDVSFSRQAELHHQHVRYLLALRFPVEERLVRDWWVLADWVSIPIPLWLHSHMCEVFSIQQQLGTTLVLQSLLGRATATKAFPRSIKTKKIAGADVSADDNVLCELDQVLLSVFLGLRPTQSSQALRIVQLSLRYVHIVSRRFLESLRTHGEHKIAPETKYSAGAAVSEGLGLMLGALFFVQFSWQLIATLHFPLTDLYTVFERQMLQLCMLAPNVIKGTSESFTSHNSHRPDPLLEIPTYLSEPHPWSLPRACRLFISLVLNLTCPIVTGVCKRALRKRLEVAMRRVWAERLSSADPCAFEHLNFNRCQAGDILTAVIRRGLASGGSIRDNQIDMPSWDCNLGASSGTVQFTMSVAEKKRAFINGLEESVHELVDWAERRPGYCANVAALCVMGAWCMIRSATPFLRACVKHLLRHSCGICFSRDQSISNSELHESASPGSPLAVHSAHHSPLLLFIFGVTAGCLLNYKWIEVLYVPWVTFALKRKWLGRSTMRHHLYRKGGYSENDQWSFISSFHRQFLGLYHRCRRFFSGRKSGRSVTTQALSYSSQYTLRPYIDFISRASSCSTHCCGQTRIPRARQTAKQYYATKCAQRPYLHNVAGDRYRDLEVKFQRFIEQMQASVFESCVLTTATTYPQEGDQKRLQHMTALETCSDGVREGLARHESWGLVGLELLIAVAAEAQNERVDHNGKTEANLISEASDNYLSSEELPCAYPGLLSFTQLLFSPLAETLQCTSQNNLHTSSVLTEIVFYHYRQQENYPSAALQGRGLYMMATAARLYLELLVARRESALSDAKSNGWSAAPRLPESTAVEADFEPVFIQYHEYLIRLQEYILHLLLTQARAHEHQILQSRERWGFSLSEVTLSASAASHQWHHQEESTVMSTRH